MSEIIKTENLQYAYPAEDGQLSVPVLKGVNLSIKRKAKRTFFPKSALH